MSKPYTGGCACGAVRYEVTGEPLVMLDCQCRQCQRESGTGHASHLTFRDAEVTLEGAVSYWDMVGDLGTAKRRAFCPTCGAPVCMTFPDVPGVFVVRAGSLDEPGRYQVQMVSWTEAGHAWDHLEPTAPKFRRMPDNG